MKANLNIVEKVDKNGKSYQIIEVQALHEKTGQYVTISEIYVNSVTASILKFLQEK